MVEVGEEGEPFDSSVSVTAHDEHDSLVLVHGLAENIPGISFDDLYNRVGYLRAREILRTCEIKGILVITMGQRSKGIVVIIRVFQE